MKNSLLLDRIYEHVMLTPTVRRAIDTPVFQRLRNLRQLGASSYLYPGAGHTRFEHSIGVAHLAGQWLSTLEEKHGSQLAVTQEERTEVALAALLHDVGHGPFSHLFEHIIMPRVAGGKINFVHEEMSVKLAEHVVVEELGLGKEAARNVSDMIAGTLQERRPERAWLGQLVNNKRSILDVDKLDYYCRDSKSCFGKDLAEVRPRRLFWGTTVLPVDSSSDSNNNNQLHELAFENKLAVTLRELTTLRSRLHRAVYQHPVTLRVGNHIGDIIATACDEDPALEKMIVDGVSDPHRFLGLGDWIFDAIGAGAFSKAVRARQLFERLQRRELYPLLGIVNLAPTEKFSATREELLKDALARKVVAEMGEGGGGVDVEDIKRSIILDRVTVHHGAGQEDPLKRVRFFNPKAAASSSSCSASSSLAMAPDVLTPAVFQERELVAMCRRPAGDPVAQKLKGGFAAASLDLGYHLRSLTSINL